MQVTQVSDHVTHAVIGGHKTISFGVAQDAELMNVLSKALYTDQILAVVRETLCNAWDAHVEHGCTDKPFIVTLTDDELTIRDFGTGIPFEKIGPIYGTYGGSTKKHDGKQTGGFGLGCKSPFAYGDHFEVTSWSLVDGKMTVYQMSKSNAEVGGKAGIIPVVSVPTTENGLQVKMKIQPKDKGRFDTLIHRILRNGEMNCIYNGQQADVIPFGEMKHNFFISDQKMIETNQQILLRYGHVIYPVEVSSEFYEEYQRVIKILDRIPNSSGQRSRATFRIVFQAPAHKISITPSREALSMQEHTIAAIKDLLTAFLAEAEARLESGCWAILDQSIKNTWLTATPKILFETKDKIPNMAIDRGIDPYITDYPQFINRYASYAYPDFKDFKFKDQMKRLDALMDAGFGDKELIASFKEEFRLSVEDRNYGRRLPDPKDPTKQIEGRSALSWFKENIVRPVQAAMLKDETMHSDKLFLYTKDHDSNWGGEVKLYKSAALTKQRNHWSYLPWLRKVVILSHNRLDFVDRARQFPVMKHWLGAVEDVMLYTVARSPKRVASAIEFWEKLGYTILDLTKAQAWEAPDVAAPVQREYKVRAKRTGIPMLRSCLNKGLTGVPIIMNLPAAEEIDLISSPDFVMKYNPKSEEPNLPGFSTTVSKFIIGKWGKKAGFVVNANQEAKYVAAGAKSYVPFLLEVILLEFQTNPRIQQTLPFLWNKSETIMETSYGREVYKREKVFLEAVYADKDLYEYFGIVQNMTEEDKLYLKMYEELRIESPDGFYGHPAQKELEKIMKAIVTDKAVMDLFDLIRKSAPLMAMNGENTRNILTGLTKVLPQQRTTVRDMLLNAIEG